MSDTPHDPEDVSPLDLNLRVQEHQLDEEMKESYLSYAMSVIIQRALPDVRDGLKPSQRRILVAMNDLGLGPRSKFRKCAKIVGDATGNYHPHGDQAVYPTLVRLAQDFNMRYQLIHPQGNFGYVDGSPPAAMRYTEAKMTAAAVELLDDLDKETVEFVANYDDTRTEPTVLPGRFPNLLCNGSQGIAVGMATSVPPHNLGEICDALVAIIDDPDVDVGRLMELVPGPDFPTGGIICGRSGIVRAYTQGRGLVTVRGKVEIEQKRGEREAIVVTELPYQVNPNTIFDRLKELIADGTIKGISNVNDETDRKAGLRLVIDLKRGENAELIVNQLYKLTPLQSTFSIIMLALDKGRPRTFDLKGMLVAFLDHRVEVIQRRTRYLLRKAQDRCHIVEGLRVAVQNIDEVVRVIKESASPEAARDALMARFRLSKRQADAILAMRLSRLTGLEVEKLEEEYAQLLADIAEYKRILGDVKVVYGMIADDLRDLKARYGDPRRTAIESIESDIEDESLIPDDAIVVSISHGGYVKRMSSVLYRAQHRGGRGVTGADLKDGDFIERVIAANNKDHFLFFTDRGRVFWMKGWQIPESSRTSRGRAIVNLLELQEDEAVSSIVTVTDFDADHYLVMVTERGYIKKTPLDAFARIRTNGLIALTLEDDDRLKRAVVTDGKQELLLATRKGMSVRFKESDVRPMGRTARGVRGVRFKTDDDRVAGLVVVQSDTALLTICEGGYGKRTEFDAYRVQGRGGSGIRNIRTARNGDVVAVHAVREDEDLLFMSEKGMVMRTGADTISLIGRDTQGVRVMALKDDDRLVTCAVLERESEEADGPAEDVLATEPGDDAELVPDPVEEDDPDPGEDEPEA